MTTYYVNSAAAGNNDGSTPEHAWTSLASSTEVAAGSEILVDDGHSENPGASVTYNWSNGTLAAPVKIICADLGTAGYPLSTGAVIAQGTSGRNIILQGNIYVDGMRFSAADSLILGGTANTRVVYRNCTFDIVVTTSARNISITGTSDGQAAEYYNCTFNPNRDTDQGIRFGGANASARMVNCIINPKEGADYVFTVSAEGSVLEVSSCSIGSATDLVGSFLGSTQVILNRCVIGSYTNMVGSFTAAGASLTLAHCQSGTISDTPLTFNGRYTTEGSCISDVAHYRTGGASDGTNDYSFELKPGANAEEQIMPIRTPPIAAWVDGGSEKTFTIYLAGAEELYNDEVWIEFEGPSNVASPDTTTRGYFYTSRCPWRTTRSALTADTESTWNGSDVSTKKKLAVTYMPQESGPVVARICYAKTSATNEIYVDPKIEVT